MRREAPFFDSPIRNFLKPALQLSAATIYGAVAVFAIVCLFVLPLTPRILDLLLSLNLILSVILLLGALTVTDRTRLYAFPTVLLISTLFRLALSVSSCRLILLRGDQGLDAAGHVIGAFGGFVVSGDFFVGAIIFAVIAVVNFLVITRGSARVAEVAARFALDALPGRQLAIDADLRSGLINADSARRRRESLNEDSRFYGAMDGAMRFIQGDAIATLVIVLINALGGTAIGISRGLEFQQSLGTFGVLAIGDGLITILPTLMVSVCAGIVVTHVTEVRKIASAQAVLAHFAADRSVILMAAVFSLILGLLPALPILPFAVISVLLTAAALRSADSSPEQIAVAEGDGVVFADDAAAGATTSVPPLSLELEASLFPTGPASRSRFTSAYQRVRADVSDQLGILLPAVQVRLLGGVQRAKYRVLVRGHLVHESTLPEGKFVSGQTALLRTFGLDPQDQMKHPLTGQTGFWVGVESEALRGLRRLGLLVGDRVDYLAAQSVGCALSLIGELFGIDDTKAIIGELQQTNPALIDEVFRGNAITTAEVTDLFRRLLRARVSIKDRKLIFESIAEYLPLAPPAETRLEWLSALHDSVRYSMARSIVDGSVGPGERLRVLQLSEEIEDEFRSAESSRDGRWSRLAVDPEIAQDLLTRVDRFAVPVVERGLAPVVVVCAADVRTTVDEFFARRYANGGWLRTLSYEELERHVRPEDISVIG
jgi:flagellar biosynthesis protein FlhA